MVLSAANFAILTAPPTVALANGVPDLATEGSNTRIGFAVTLTAVTNEDVILTYSTIDGTAAAGSDFVGVSGGQVTIAAGSTSTTIWIDLLNDNVAEYAEVFTLRLDAAQLATSGTALDITATTGTGNIADDETEHSLVAIHDMAAIGSSDPSGLAYVPGSTPGSGTLFLSDSEVEESPFFRPTNLFALKTDGTLIETFDLVSSFTDEPTGLAFNPVTGHLYISDDDQEKIFWVDPANPTVKLGEFATQPLGVPDPEDLAVDSSNGHLFLLNAPLTAFPQRTIIETTSTGQLFSTITLPEVITDPEALAYDATNDVFYVGGGFSFNIWVVDRSGTIVDLIDILSGFSKPIVHVKDLELAPTSDPNDDPALLSLYVADYGYSHVNDGRLFEIDLGDPVNEAPAFTTSPANPITWAENTAAATVVYDANAADPNAGTTIRLCTQRRRRRAVQPRRSHRSAALPRVAELRSTRRSHPRQQLHRHDHRLGPIRRRPADGRAERQHLGDQRHRRHHHRIGRQRYHQRHADGRRPAVADQ